MNLVFILNYIWRYRGNVARCFILSPQSISVHKICQVRCSCFMLVEYFFLHCIARIVQRECLTCNLSLQKVLCSLFRFRAEGTSQQKPDSRDFTSKHHFLQQTRRCFAKPQFSHELCFHFTNISKPHRCKSIFPCVYPARSLCERRRKLRSRSIRNWSSPNAPIVAAGVEEEGQEKDHLWQYVLGSVSYKV